MLEPIRTSTLVEPQPSSQEGYNVNQDQSLKNIITSVKFYSYKDL